MPNTRLILHIKGTERETTELPKQVVRAAISQGQITHSQLIWSPLHNAWKQVREMPQLWPSQKLAPAPPIRAASGALPKVEATPSTAQGTPVPKVKIAASGNIPRVKAVPKAAVAAPGAPAAVPGKPETSVNSLVVKEKETSHPLRWICIGLGALIVINVALNFLLVDRPLVSRLSETSYGSVPVFGHLGAFIQPDVLIMHIGTSSAVNQANLTDFLVALARSTPQAPLTGNTFERVAITSGWTGEYSFSGFAWKQLGDMGTEDAGQRKDFILEQMGNAAGQPVLSGNSNLSDEERQNERNRVWSDFAALFTRS